MKAKNLRQLYLVNEDFAFLRPEFTPSNSGRNLCLQLFRLLRQDYLVKNFLRHFMRAFVIISPLKIFPYCLDISQIVWLYV